jgi:starch-binding outer membrane protein, SusD/RagB family
MINMKTTLYKFLLFALPMGLLTYSCADLEVENWVEPDSAKALNSPEDLKGVAGGAFKTVHNAAQEYDGPALSMGGMADQTTCSWGNAAMRDLGKEPRPVSGFNNSVTYAYFPVISAPWGAFYSSISSVNDVIKAIEGGMEFGPGGTETKMVEAWCYFVSGAAHSYVSLIYDQGNLINYDTDVSSVALVPWTDIRDGALALLDKAIQLADANEFQLPVSWVAGQSMDNEGLSRLAASYAARTMVYTSRNKIDNEAIDWNKVLAYTNKGIITDFAPELGDAYNWFDMYFIYQTYSGWGRVDNRIINILDNSKPFRWEDGNTAGYGQATSPDARLLSDFGYLSAQAFPPDRGYYWFSSYRFKRYDHVTSSVWYGDKPKPSFLAWENEMLKAEALARTGNAAGAVTILNSPSGARKVRGLLPDVTASSAAEVIQIILDEKDVELFDSGMGIGYFDMRRTDRLQSGTILHFPIPATELQIANIPVYTISGAPDGINISKGGWTGYSGK